MNNELTAILAEGLDAGLTINEIKEILVQMYAYCGFPRSLNGISTFMSITEDRRKKGIKDEIGKEASPLPTNKSSIELGTEIQTRLAGRPVTGAIYTFTPAIDQFLKGHLFGDIFGRDNLDFPSREIATKFGFDLSTQVVGSPGLNSRPEHIKQVAEESLK